MKKLLLLLILLMSVSTVFAEEEEGCGSTYDGDGTLKEVFVDVDKNGLDDNTGLPAATGK